MKIQLTFDSAKNARNIQMRGMDFNEAANFDWSTALIALDTRQDYSEQRYQALGYVDGDVCMLVFTPRGDAIHVISFRRANKRERIRYATQTQT